MGAQIGGNFAYLAHPEKRLQMVEVNTMAFDGVLRQTREMRTLEFRNKLFERHPFTGPPDFEQAQHDLAFPMFQDGLGELLAGCLGRLLIGMFSRALA